MRGGILDQWEYFSKNSIIINDMMYKPTKSEPNTPDTTSKVKHPMESVGISEGNNIHINLFARSFSMQTENAPA